MVEACVVEESCPTEHSSVRWVPLLCSQALHKYNFSLGYMKNGIGNLFSGMFVDILSKCLFVGIQLAGKPDIVP